MVELDKISRYTEIVKALNGEIIDSISNCQYFFNGERDNEDLGDVEILTSSGLRVCFTLLGDGESVGAYRGDLNIQESFEVVEGAQASWEKLSLKQNMSGSKIIVVEAMYDKHPQFDSQVLSGWRIKLENNDYLVFYNCGDNAQVLFNEEPKDAIEGMITTWQRI